MADKPNYQNKFKLIKPTDILGDSYETLNNNNEALRSNFSGQTLPTSPAPVNGQKAFINNDWHTYVEDVTTPANSKWVRDAKLIVPEVAMSVPWNGITGRPETLDMPLGSIIMSWIDLTPIRTIDGRQVWQYCNGDPIINPSALLSKFISVGSDVRITPLFHDRTGRVGYAPIGYRARTPINFHSGHIASPTDAMYPKSGWNKAHIHDMQHDHEFYGSHPNDRDADYGKGRTEPKYVTLRTSSPFTINTGTLKPNTSGNSDALYIGYYNPFAAVCNVPAHENVLFFIKIN